MRSYQHTNKTERMLSNFCDDLSCRELTNNLKFLLVFRSEATQS